MAQYFPKFLLVAVSLGTVAAPVDAVLAQSTSPFTRQGLPGIEQLGPQGPAQPAKRPKRLFGDADKSGLGIDPAAPGTAPCPPNCSILDVEATKPIPRPPELRPDPLDCRRSAAARRDCIAAGYPVRP